MFHTVWVSRGSAQLAWCDPVRVGGWGGEGGGVGVRIVYKMYVEGAITVRVWEWCMCEGVRSVCERVVGVVTM